MKIEENKEVKKRKPIIEIIVSIIALMIGSGLTIVINTDKEENKFQSNITEIVNEIKEVSQNIEIIACSINSIDDLKSCLNVSIKNIRSDYQDAKQNIGYIFDKNSVPFPQDLNIKLSKVNQGLNNITDCLISGGK